MDYTEMSLQRLTREKIFIERQLSNLMSQKKQIEKELDKRYDNGELGEEEN
jgi:hypothetical protein